MAGGGTAGVDLTRKFVTEAELDDKRKKRQEEWDKVRKPEDPEGENCPDLRTNSNLDWPPLIFSCRRLTR